MNLESARLRYHLRKRMPVPASAWWCVMTYGVDTLYGDEPPHHVCRWEHNTLLVMWRDNPDYAEEVKDWWDRNQVVSEIRRACSKRIKTVPEKPRTFKPPRWWILLLLRGPVICT
jgi:hypothetical protein